MEFTSLFSRESLDEPMLEQAVAFQRERLLELIVLALKPNHPPFSLSAQGSNLHSHLYTQFRDV